MFFQAWKKMVADNGLRKPAILIIKTGNSVIGDDFSALIFFSV